MFACFSPLPIFVLLYEHFPPVYIHISAGSMPWAFILHVYTPCAFYLGFFSPPLRLQRNPKFLSYLAEDGTSSLRNVLV